MSEQELLAIVSNAESSAVIFSGEFSAKNERLLKDYLSQPYGDEVRDQSQVISTDVQDVVESDMPSLARVFLGSNQPVAFESNTLNPQELQEVEEKNKYVNHLIMNQPWSYQTLFSWMKESEIQKNGVVKYFMEDSRKSEEVRFENVSQNELNEILLDLQRDDVQKIEIVGRGEQTEDQLISQEFDITFKVTRGKQEFKVINVPVEQFLISKSASSLDNAELVGDKVNNKTRGQLLAEGFERKLINSLPTISTDRNSETSIKNIRNKDTGDTIGIETVNDWANELVELTDLYIKIDFDGDGIAERRHILKSGNNILINEPFDHVPYASLSCYIMPHKAIGRSRAELTQQTQRVKTVLLRQTLDNIYTVNHPRNVLHPDVNVDDYLKIRMNGAIRLKKDSAVLPGQAIHPLVVPPMMQQSLQVIQYMDSTRAQSTGTYLASQGLDADAIAKETATRFTGIEEKGSEKIELVARTMAETGWRKLYEGAAWTVSRFQDSATEITVLGKQLTVDPTKWRNNHHVVSKVGLGAGDPEKMVGSMQGVLGIQQQLQSAGSPMVDQSKLFNTLQEIIKGLGFKQVDKFFNDPEQPDQLLQAENEILKKQMQQMQQLLEQLQAKNPLAEAEQVKAEGALQAKIFDLQTKQSTDAAELAESKRQFNIETAQKASQSQKKVAFDLTKLEVDSGKNIPGSAV
jgi:hypothetical protein